VAEARKTRKIEFHISLDGFHDFSMTWEEMISHRGGLTCLEPLDGGPCHLAFTSGTTYTPKPAVLSHEPTCRAAKIIAEHLQLSRDDKTLGITTLSSSHILVYGILPQLHVGAEIGIMERWNPIKAWITIIKERVRVVSGTSILLQELIEEAERQEITETPLRFVLSGGSPAYRALRGRWKRLGVKFIETYGMSELGGSAALGKPTTIKKKPVKPFEGVPPIGPPPRDKVIKIVDESGKELPIGKPGTIMIKGGHMWGYWNMPEETEKVLVNGWLKTDDIDSLTNTVISTSSQERRR